MTRGASCATLTWLTLTVRIDGAELFLGHSFPIFIAAGFELLLTFPCPLVEVMVRFPIPEDEIERFKETIGTSKPDKPFAFIFGHGLWNDLDLQAHINWIDTVLDATTSNLPYLAQEGALWPRLVVTPNAAGRNKPDEWLVSQGNKALSMYEDSVRVEDGRKGIEHLGTYNMSVQANMYDGG